MMIIENSGDVILVLGIGENNAGIKYDLLLSAKKVIVNKRGWVLDWDMKENIRETSEISYAKVR